MRKHLVFILLLFVVKTSFAQSLTARFTSMPDHIEPGSTFTVGVSIIKGTINSFIKFTQELPPTYVVGAVDLKGGTFTYADSMLKIIWVFPPAGNEYSFSYTITVPKDASGVQKIGGKIFYLFNTNRQVFEFEPKMVAIGSAAVAMNPPVANTSEVNKGSDANVAVIPKSKENDNLADVTNFNSNASSNAKASKPTTNSSDSKVKETTAANTNNTSAKVENKSSAVNSTKVATTASTSTDIIPGRTYRVQFGAFKGKPNYNGIVNLSTVTLDNGITKYLTGDFTTYAEAYNKKDEMIAKGFAGAFIVPFDNGKLAK
jgi:hypothetical protein